jgi:hypothetical protein
VRRRIGDASNASREERGEYTGEEQKVDDDDDDAREEGGGGHTFLSFFSRPTKSKSASFRFPNAFPCSPLRAVGRQNEIERLSP